eukprot:1181553-Prorocentrum_minimum.AAC.3
MQTALIAVRVGYRRDRRRSAREVLERIAHLVRMVIVIDGRLTIFSVALPNKGSCSEAEWRSECYGECIIDIDIDGVDTETMSSHQRTHDDHHSMRPAYLIFTY